MPKKVKLFKKHFNKKKYLLKGKCQIIVLHDNLDIIILNSKSNYFYDFDLYDVILKLIVCYYYPNGKRRIFDIYIELNLLNTILNNNFYHFK